MQFRMQAALAALAVMAFVSAHAAVGAATTSPPTYASEIAYTQTRPAFTPTRTIDVASASQFTSAVSNLHPGDLVKATAPFTVSGETIIGNRLSAPAVIDLSGATVKFVYSGGQNTPAVWIKNVQNLRIFGGDLSTADTGGSCLNWTASQHSLWWGWKAHDCGGTGLSMFNAKPGYSYAGPVSYDDVQGEAWKFGQHRAWDPHAEKCSGLHGANLADDNNYSFDHNRIALYAHDSACAGAGIEFGSSHSTNIPANNTIILKATNLSFLSKTQTGGNCYQTWGYGNKSTDLEYLECSNVTGHPYWSHGLNDTPNNELGTDTVDYARAANVRQNPRYVQDPNYDKTGATVFKDVAPMP